MSIALLIFGLIMFVGLVVVHEWGHYIAARRNGIEVEEFGIGFPPRAKIIKKRHGTVFSLNWLPLGGFVKLKGEHDADTEKGSFGAATLLAKVKVMTAGVGMNLLTAFIMFTLLALVGMPKILDNQFTVGRDTEITKYQTLVGAVESGSPADQAGIKKGQEIQAIYSLDPSSPFDSALPVNGPTSLPGITQQFAGHKVQVSVIDNGQVQTKELTLRSQQEVDDSKKANQPKGYLGVVPTEYALQRSTWSAPIVAVGLIIQLTQATLQGLGSALANVFQGNGAAASAQVAGPVGIFVLLKDGSLLGYQFVLLIIAVISLTLAIMNILPIPALDGGRLVTILLSRLFRKPLTAKQEEMINGIGFVLLMGLFVLITVVDVKRNF